jgi:hypothetical protein
VLPSLTTDQQSTDGQRTLTTINQHVHLGR